MEDESLNRITKNLLRHSEFIPKAKYNQTLHYAVIRLVRLIRENPILNGIIVELEGQTPNVGAVKTEVAKIMAEQGAQDFGDEASFVLCSFYVLEACASAGSGAEHTAARVRCLNPRNHVEELETFYSVYVEPVVACLIDNLSNIKYVLSHLLKFKQDVEWFGRAELQALIVSLKGNHKMIERELNIRLYRYLHDRGVEFYIEPSSAEARGRVDLIGAQGTNPQLLLDGKYLGDNKKLVSYIASAFSQVYGYTQQYNRPNGYIVLFKNLEPEIQFKLSNAIGDVSYVDFNGKRIYFLLVDIYDYEKPPSQRGRLSPVIVTEENLTAKIVEV